MNASLYIYNSWNSIHQRLEVGLKIVLPIFPARVAGGKPHFDFSVKFIPHQLNGIADCCPKDFIPLLYCPVFLRLGPLEPFDTVLLPQRQFVDSNSTIEARFTESSPLCGCWHIFSHWFRCALIFAVVSLLLHKLVTLMKLSSALVFCFWSTSPTFGLVLFRFLILRTV